MVAVPFLPQPGHKAEVLDVGSEVSKVTETVGSEEFPRVATQYGVDVHLVRGAFQAHLLTG